jgi:iron complex outermembrane receptor protein
MTRHAALLACAMIWLAPAGSTAAQRPIPLDTLHVPAGSRLTAGVARVTRSVDVFDREAIEALPARSVTDIITRGMGVDLLARSPAQADLSIRGGSFEQVLVLVDGVPVNDRQTGHFHLDVAVPLDAVERIEILRGPASAVYGSSAVGGVVNIVTRRRIAEFSARAQGGSFGAFAFGAEAGGSVNAMSIRIGAEHDAADGHRAGTDHAITQARVSLDAPIARGSLRADAGFAARDFGASEFYAPFDSYEETRTATASAAWRSRPARLVIEPRVSFRRHDDDFILQRADPSFYRNVHITNETDAELVARWQAGPRIAIAGGGSANRSTIDSNSLGERVERRIAGFAEAAIGDVAAGLLTLGVRLDDHSAFGSFLSSSAAAGYRASPALRVRASAASGFRAPSWTDRYYEDPANIGSPDLEVERFWTAELGVEATVGRSTLDVAGFIRHAGDLIDWGRPSDDPDTAPWRTLNVEEAVFRGVEATARIRVNTATVTGRGSLLSFDADESDGFVSKYALQPLTRSASLEVAVPLTTHASLALRGATSRRADDETWTVLDARASLTAFGVRFFADATNLFDTSWLDVSAQPAAGRAFSIGARVRR